MSEKSKAAAGAGNGRSNSTAAPHIVVCIKPVPDPASWEKLGLDPDTMLLNRTDLPAVINPLDLNAIEQALILKETSGATISVLTMAPPEAEEQLREALAMGCDKAYLASDLAFAGADTLATSRCLAAAISKIGKLGKLGAVDLIFCGSYSLDGSTAQVGPQIAEILGIPDLTGAVSLELSAGSVHVACKVEEGTLVAECDLPVLVTFDREAACPRLATMSGIRRARELPIVVWSYADLGLDPEAVGLAGSPTHMLNVFAQAQGRKGEILGGSPSEVAGALVSRLLADKALD
jgi:electron transfer flavoprotein beta subunit